MELVIPYLEMEDFTLENAKKVSSDVAGLASWSKAMVIFYGVNKEVLPLKVRCVKKQKQIRMIQHPGDFFTVTQP